MPAQNHVGEAGKLLLSGVAPHTDHAPAPAYFSSALRKRSAAAAASSGPTLATSPWAIAPSSDSGRTAAGLICSSLTNNRFTGKTPSWPANSSAVLFVTT